ncbi:DNA-3-methyladenine glycosylase 2 family protein [Aeromicrobium terrae]|uniref:DNA-3-methyladenine glycosylase II n=2 Tax=Aeromicrobium terrae TaxID=2498846 RepID=A0A5C8NNA9_9ACTN|nr:DNA-3-methyladenine glycosylase 2 family protein [Aeromicrobium terrae]
MVEDHDRCYRAVRSRDARFDGVFYTGVRTTGIYCRPSCPARTPHQHNVEFFPSAAAAQEAGFRACRRCRPDTTPGSPEWNLRADAVARAMRLIGDGLVEREGVDGLASRLGFSTRHVNRMLTAELGAGPLALARSRRSQAARVLIETTDMAMADIAFAAGFASIRQFNDSIRTVYGLTPTEMRGRRGGKTSGRLAIRLAVRRPFDPDGLLTFLGDRAIAGVEHVEGRVYARILRLPNGLGAVRLTLHDDRVEAELELADLRDTAVAVERCRRLLDLDADPVAIGDVLAADPLLAPSVAEVPGIRLPGQVDGFEVVVRAIVGQQVSVAGARTILGRFAAAYGTPATFDLAAEHGLTHAFATAEAMADADDTALSMPRSRAQALIGVARSVAAGELDLEPGADRDATHKALLGHRGIGPWTADYVVMRAFGHPDVMLETDLIIKRMLDRYGVDAARTATWQPWRSYAALHLWRLASTPKETA